MDVPAAPVAAPKKGRCAGRLGLERIGAGMAGISNKHPTSINKL